MLGVAIGGAAFVTAAVAFGMKRARPLTTSATSALPLARLKAESSAVLICDIQEKFRAAIHKFPAVVDGCKRMGEAAKLLGMPTIVTEQYPKGLGHTVEEVDLSKAAVCAAKTDFSMIVPEVSAKLTELKVTDAVIVGLEAHVCVQQTTFDLLTMGCNVHLCVDAISSQSPKSQGYGDCKPGSQIGPGAVELGGGRPGFGLDQL